MAILNLIRHGADSVNIIKNSVDLIKSVPLASVINLSMIKNLALGALSPSRVLGPGGASKGLELAIITGLAGSNILKGLDHGQRGLSVAEVPGSRDTASQHIDFGLRHAAAAVIAIAAGILPSGGPKEIAKVVSFGLGLGTSTQSRLLEASQLVNPGDPLKNKTFFGAPLFFTTSPHGGTMDNPWLFNALGGVKYAQRDKELLSEPILRLNQSQVRANAVLHHGSGVNPLTFLFSEHKSLTTEPV